MTIETMNYVFDRTAHQPSSGQMPPLPASMYQVKIEEVKITELQDSKGNAFSVQMEVQDGEYKGRKIFNNYNLWHATSADAVRISHEQLSALCWAAGVTTLDFRNGGKALVGASLVVKVDNDGKRNNVKEVYNHAGFTGYEIANGITKPSQPAPVAVVSNTQNTLPNGFIQPAAPVATVGTVSYAPQPASTTIAPQPAPVATGWGVPA